MTPLNPEITRIETLIAAGRLNDAGRRLARVLEAIENSRVEFGDGDPSATAIQAAATRLAAAVTRLLTDAAYRPTIGEIRSMVVLKRAMTQVFEISGYRGTGHLPALIGIDLETVPSPDMTARLLMGLSLNDSAALVPEIIDQVKPGFRLSVVMAFLGEYLVWPAEAEAARTALLRYRDVPDQSILSTMELTLLASVWMACSYADAPDRHQFKLTLNRVVRHWLESRGVADTARRRPAARRSGKPTLLIIAEQWYRGHAMDRCYRPSVRALGRYFHTVFMSADSRKREFDASLVDEVDPTMFDVNKPEEFIARAQSHEADMVYFPSVGMRLGGVAAANVRLAPIQVATLGHPATTHSPSVDYIVTSGENAGDGSCFSETLLTRPFSPQYVRWGEAPAPEIRRRPECVRLAVPAWVRKLTPRFLETCREITRRAERPVEFRFFPNVRATMFQALRRRLEQELPAQVYPHLPYAEYLARLGECDIHLSTFPFGSSNGIVDSALLGLPLVNLLGPEPHSRVDAMLVRRLAQPEWLTVADQAAYIDAVLRLVHDDDRRVEISEAIVAGDPASQLLLDDDGEVESLAVILDLVMRHHESLAGDGRRLWSYDQLASLDQGARAAQGT